MSRFGWVFITYTIYLSVLTIGNTASFIMEKPVLALGYINKWWFIMAIFLIAYISEWASIFVEKGG